MERVPDSGGAGGGRKAAERRPGARAAEGGVRPQGRRPLRLPFDGRRQDAGGWAYDHRVGLCVTLTAYLLLGIAFVSSRIAIHGRASQRGIVVDLQSLEVLADERDRLEEEVRRSNASIDWKSIRNVASNENALNENLKDDRGTNTASLNRSAGEVERSMQVNREMYERGMAEVRAIGGERPSDAKGGDDRDSKVNGTVTVSYSFVDPVRESRTLVKPAYRCESGGEVVVSAAIDRMGEVVAAQVVSGGDECMRRTALEAARGSRFDHNGSAPARQVGTIRYVFIPQ